MTDITTIRPTALDQGTGEPALVFLHYFGGAAASWQWVIQALRSQFRCIAIDLPGFGHQPPLSQPTLEHYADFVAETLNAAAINKFVLIGHSMGGKIALQVAAAGQVQPQQVILIAPSPPTQEPMPKEEKQRLLNHHPSEDNAATTIENATQQALSAEQRAIALQTHTQAAGSAWRWWLETGMNHSIADQLDLIQVPVTVLASPDDPVIPFDTIQQEVMALIATAQLVEIPGVGHLLPLEAPEQVAQAIRSAVHEPSAV